jgi:CheY-like chemotaxis protein
MKKVIFIEDNLEIRENTVEILELASYKVFAAADGNEGMVMIMQHLPNIILCDIHMPNMNGFEVFWNVKANATVSGIPFVFVTASAEKKEMESALSLGADGYICKPFDSKELLELVFRLLGSAKDPILSN